MLKKYPVKMIVFRFNDQIYKEECNLINPKIHLKGTYTGENTSQTNQ